MLKSKSRTERKGLRKRFIEKRKLFNRDVQRSKRAYTLQRQVEIENLETTNPNLFWKEIGKIGIGQERRKFIPMEVTRDDGSISSDTGEVLNKWKNSFESLLNHVNGNVENICENHPVNDSQADAPLCFTEPIHLSEVAQAIRRLKLNESTGIDDIPAEVLKSSSLLHILCSLFNRCFIIGKVPKFWNSGIIVPVPKSTTSDAREPMFYRGINVTPAIYKLYCNILNERLQKWEQEQEIINDAQNGFRKGRSTIDHVLS